MTNRSNPSPATASVLPILGSGPDQANWDPALDGVTAAPESHKVIFEDEQVRILDVQLPVGAREPVHTHVLPGILSYVTECQVGYLAFDHDGTAWVPQCELQTRDAFVGYSRLIPPEAPHSVANIGNTHVRAFRIEIKSAKPDR